MTAGLGAALAIGMVPTAQAGTGEGTGESATPTTAGGTITITVSGTALKGGSPGQTVSRHVSVPAPCWMEPSYTGKEYYEFATGTGEYAGKGMSWVNAHTGETMTPEPGYEKYKDDTAGHWWGGICSSGNYDGSIKDFFTVADTFFKAHPFTYIPAGQPVPVPPVPPEVLRDAALAEMELPTPAIDWNPKRAGTNGTLVNLDTWVWLKDRRDKLYVQATANTMGGQTMARVDVELTGMTLEAEGATTAVCDGPGIPYSQGASAAAACTIQFTKASATAAGTSVRTQTIWHGTWFATGRAPTDLPTQPVVNPSVTPIRVGEVQAVVNR
ncbi:MAG TPA: hypothetical protein VGD15_11735 [Kribbella sp.]